MIKDNLWIGTGIIFALLLAVLALKYYQVNSLKRELAESKTQIVILSQSIETQNQSILNAAEDSRKRLADSLEAIKQAKSISLHRQTKINALNAQLGKVSDCDSAVQIAKDNL